MLDILARRRSIRRYKPTRLEPDIVQLLLKAALLSPSSKGSHPWEFIVVDEPEILRQLSLAKKGAGLLKGAALAIVVLADPVTSDVWVEDAAVAATILHLTAEALGLGSCWIQIRERQFTETETAEHYVQRILEIPDPLKVVVIISVGYPDECKSPYPDSNLRVDKLHLNKYGSAIKFKNH
ncbi:MAG: nitroreductase family protein [Desulfitobacteriaceae bacterium]